MIHAKRMCEDPRAGRPDAKPIVRRGRRGARAALATFGPTVASNGSSITFSSSILMRTDAAHASPSGTCNRVAHNGYPLYDLGRAGTFARVQATTKNRVDLTHVKQMNWKKSLAIQVRNGL